MGACCVSKAQDTRINIDQTYRTKNLPLPEPTDYENDFEREAFQTVNLIRNDPKYLIPQLRLVKSN